MGLLSSWIWLAIWSEKVWRRKQSMSLLQSHSDLSPDNVKINILGTIYSLWTQLFKHVLLPHLPHIGPCAKLDVRVISPSSSFCGQRPRAERGLLLLSPGAGALPRSAWCWRQWLRHLLHGGFREGAQFISLPHCCVCSRVHLFWHSYCETSCLDCIEVLTFQTHVRFHFLTEHTFRQELDKYVQGLQSCLQTPEVWKRIKFIKKKGRHGTL